jgi:HSP20 family protein
MRARWKTISPCPTKLSTSGKKYNRAADLLTLTGETYFLIIYHCNNNFLSLRSINLQEPNMDYIKIRFADDIGKIDVGLQGTIDAMFNMVSPMYQRRQCAWRPQVDVCETTDELLILSELAGVNREDLRIELGRKTVKIYGIRREENLTRNARYRLAEIPYGYFERSLSLPWPIDRESVEATLTEGLLQVRLVKLPIEKVHTISIRTS